MIIFVLWSLACREKFAAFKTFKFKRNVFFWAITVICRMPGTSGINLLNTGLVFLQKDFCTVLMSDYSTNDKIKLHFYESKRFLEIFLQLLLTLRVWVAVRSRLLSEVTSLKGQVPSELPVWVADAVKNTMKGVIKEWWFALWSSHCLINPQIKIPTPQPDSRVLNSDFSNTPYFSNTSRF